jgi:hypothetical protein
MATAQQARLPGVMHHPDPLPQGDARRCPARHGCPVGRLCHLEVVHASDDTDGRVQYTFRAPEIMQMISGPAIPIESLPYQRPRLSTTNVSAQVEQRSINSRAGKGPVG